MSKMIMVVDDEPDILETIKIVLESGGFEVVTAINGDDCLEKIKRFTPALILLDVMMPGTPVGEIIPKLNGIKVAYLTAVRPTEAEKEKLLGSANVVDFIQKPFDVKELLERVSKIVGET